MKNLNIEIDSTERFNEVGVSKNGKSYDFDHQKGYMKEEGAKYPKEIQIPLEKNQAPYPKGTYCQGDCFSINTFNRIQFKLVLEPLSVTKAA